jgi:hypothetical protein
VNSQIVKDFSIPKAIRASQFQINVEKGEIKWENLDEETKANINSVIIQIQSIIESSNI